MENELPSRPPLHFSSLPPWRATITFYTTTSPRSGDHPQGRVYKRDEIRNGGLHSRGNVGKVGWSVRRRGCLACMSQPTGSPTAAGSFVTQHLHLRILKYLTMSKEMNKYHSYYA